MPKEARIFMNKDEVAPRRLPGDFAATMLGEVVLLHQIIRGLIDKGLVGREDVGELANDVIRDSSRSSSGLRAEYRRLGMAEGLRVETLSTGWVNAVVSVQAHTHEQRTGDED